MTRPAAGSLGESTDNTSTHSAAHSIKSPAGDCSQVMTTLSPVQPLPSEDEDKQYVRDWLRANWDMTGEPPRIPKEVIEGTSKRYQEAFQIITGTEFAPARA